MTGPSSVDTMERSCFLASARSRAGVVEHTETLARWLRDRSGAQRCRVEPVPFSALCGWRFEPTSGDLVHESGHFFRVQGIRARSDFPVALRFEQPIINQPEVGVLGILAKRFDGVLHFLLQAKMEPGNINLVQLSPTVQATRSNYTRVHGGTTPRYLEYFVKPTRGRVLIDQLQSEQGLFFRRKRNRNIIVETDADVPPHDDFQWFTLGQIKELVREPHTVNMDTRTVLAAIPLVGADEAQACGRAAGPDAASFGDALVASTLASSGYYSISGALSWLAEIRASAEIDSWVCPLNDVHGWQRTDHDIRREDGRYFRVCGITVESDSREVAGWSQPVLQPMGAGLAAFVTRRIGGILHFLVQARMEPGVWNLIELGPTVQYLPGTPLDEGEKPFMLDEVMSGRAGTIHHRSTQSEEGGRFFHYTTENIVVELEANDDRPIPRHYTWLTLGQLNLLLQYGNHLNIEARSVLACLDVA